MRTLEELDTAALQTKGLTLYVTQQEWLLLLNHSMLTFKDDRSAWMHGKQVLVSE